MYEDIIPPKSSKDRQSFFLEKAARIAQKSNMTHKHGCIIVQDDVIIAEGWNKITKHYNHSFSIHAEVDAIKKFKKIYNKSLLSQTEMYIVRIGSKYMDNCLKYSKPCENCQSVIMHYGIPKVFYSTNYEFDLIMQSQR